MFSFDHTEDGLYCSKDGYGVARIDTKVISETNDPNLKVQRRLETPLPKERWVVHFCSHRMTPGEVEAFARELAAQPG